MVMARAKVLIIYTGGTIGMIRDEKKGTLKPFRLNRMTKSVPSILEMGLEIHALELEEVIDSSNMTPEVWIELVGIIEEHYDAFDGFVVLHGSDTMAHSASALSFLLENLGKPVVFTGSQLPLGLPRTDARENLITALEIAALKDENGNSLIPEVCIYFEDQLYRGNRTHKFNSENFDAFISPNYPALAASGVKIELALNEILPLPTSKPKFHSRLNTNIGMIRLFPGICLNPYIKMFIETGIELVVLETYGSGNGPTKKGFLNSIKTLIENNIIVFNVTQCRQGHVEMDKYEAGSELAAMGVISGNDISLEAAITKAMFVLGSTENHTERLRLMQTALRGEITP
jgi:L-asparaginase